VGNRRTGKQLRPQHHQIRHRLRYQSQEYSQIPRCAVYSGKRELCKIPGKLLRLAKTKLYKLNNEERIEDLDNTLCTRISEDMAIEKSVEEFHEVLKLACNKSFRTQWASKKATAHKPVPWWTEELAITRKTTNAVRRRYHRTRNNEEVREQHKTQYFEGKARYAETNENEKISSWKEYCSMTTSANPWNEVCKLAAGKISNNTQITTLRKPD
jgi:hypothetical protein